MSKMSALSQVLDDVKEQMCDEYCKYRKCLTCGAIFITVERLVDPRIEKEYENERKDSIIDR